MRFGLPLDSMFLFWCHFIRSFIIIHLVSFYLIGIFFFWWVPFVCLFFGSCELHSFIFLLGLKYFIYHTCTKEDFDCHRMGVKSKLVIVLFLSHL